jgi:alkanesulfonate monooxygenase SsuD/methylene tetrahydromethanopterin reductase-like flavin-dependent oxidoreductase (luciferase family)
MMDGKTVRFDMLTWQVVPWPVMRDDVLYLETLDIGTVWLGDGYAMPAAYGGSVLEAWTTLAALAVHTTRVRLGTLISNVGLRHPAMLAKQAATVDCISGGRLDLGLGPGEPQETTWLGLPALTPGARVDRLAEAVEVIDRLLREHRISYQGSYYQLDDAPLEPVPVQRPRPPLVLAADGKRALRIAARHADVWVTIPDGKGTREDAVRSVRERGQLLDEYCGALGRAPSTVERACIVGWGGPETPFASVEALRDFVGRYREAGAQRIIFCFGSTATPAPYDAWIAARAWVSRALLEAFAAQVLTDLSSPSSTP